MTNVTAIVSDSSGNIYANALVIASFVGQNTTPGAGPYITGGVPQGQFETVVPGTTDSFGALAMPITGNDTITPAPSQWRFTVVSNTTPQVSFSVLITITGASQDISAALQAASALINPLVNFGDISVTGIVVNGDASVIGARGNPGNLNVTGVIVAGSYNNNLSAFAPTTSAQLASIMTDETGSGPLVFAGGNIGAATATSVNKVAITPVANAATLDILNNKTLLIDNTLELAGPDGSVQTFQATGTIVSRTSADTLTNKRVTPRQVAMADAASVTPTSDTADINTFVSTQVSGTLTVNAPSGTPTDGQKLILRLKSTNAQTYSFNATYAFSTTVTAPTTLAAGKTDYIGLIWDATNTKWDVVAVDQGH